MGDYGSGSLQPAGHMGRIPNFKNNHGDNFQTRCAAEPPACVQNAMMTKDKKPFTYTPGGLDLSQIRTPSMARRHNKQQHEEQDNPTYNHSHTPYHNGGSHVGSGGAPPPPPPPPVAGPPPPPPLLIQAPNARSAKPVTLGERPEIVIPENPIGMLRKTHSPYHWESENAEKQNQGLKFVDKSATPSPVHPHMNAAPPPHFSQHPQQFSQQPPQQYYQQQKQPETYAPPPFQETSFQNRNQMPLAPQSIGSPVHKPEPKYPSPQQNISSPPNGDRNMRDLLQRQDSQFNNSPAPWSLGSPQNSPQPKFESQMQSPSPSNASPIYANAGMRKLDSNNSPIYQNDKPTYVSPANSIPTIQSQNRNVTPQSSTFSSPYSNRNVSNSTSSATPTPSINNSPFPSPASPQSAASPNNSDRGQMSPQQKYYPNSNQPQVSPNVIFNNCNPNQQQTQVVNNANTAPWRTASQTSPTQNESNNIPTDVRYQTRISIPVTPRNNVPMELPTQQKEAVYVTQEPVYYHNPESPKIVPGWVRSQKEKTPPPEWCQRANDIGRKSIPNDDVSQEKENNAQPAWVQKANELRKSVPRDVVSQEKDKDVQPPWVQKAAELRRNVPSDMSNSQQPSQVQPTWAQKPSENRNIPIKMEVSSKEVLRNETSNQTQQNNSQQPQLRIIIDMNQKGVPHSGLENNASYSQPTQRIMRALQPQLVRIDRPDPNLPTVNPNISSDLNSATGQQPKTRIIPIRIEPGSPVANPKSFSIGGRS